MKENEGLSKKEVEESRLKYGENKISEYKKKNFLQSFISNLNDPIIRVLIIALFVNIIFTIGLLESLQYPWKNNIELLSYIDSVFEEDKK